MKSCLTKALIIIGSSALVIGVSYYFVSKSTPLPVLRPSQINPLLVDSLVRKNMDHRVSYFSFYDQQGNITDSVFLDGHVHVADFFFTTCQTICPIMSGKMDDLSQRFDKEEPVKFLSFSVIPEEDSIPALAAYAQAYRVDYSKWRLLTGTKESIYSLARRSYFTLKPAEVGQGDGGSSDFIHTNNFVLVDSKQRLRGYYDGTSDREIDRLEEDIRSLLKEESELNQ